MPRAYYSERVASGAITDDDLAAALGAQPTHLRPADVTALKAAAREPGEPARALPMIASLAAEASGTDWPGLVNERFGTWAAAYFDEGQALWSAPRAKSAFAAWRAFATQDLTPEIIGLRGFASFIADAPEMANLVLVRAAATLGLEPAALETYFHSLLMSLGGWAHVARYRLWQAELAGSTDTTLVELLAIRLLWEEALFNQYGEAIRPSWEDAARAHAAPVAPTSSQVVDVILQEAAELATRVLKPSAARPALQAAFCIDVRSEVFRRALESVNSGITTLGFAGFFGVATSHRRFASDVHEHRLPVLLNAGVSSCSGDSADAADDRTARIGARSSRAWGRFKLAARVVVRFCGGNGARLCRQVVARCARSEVTWRSGRSGAAACAEPGPCRTHDGCGNDPARDVSDGELRASRPSGRTWRQRDEQPACQCAPLWGLWRLFG
jgi:uncharacterized protein YbcC (UPF0753/DUF2309 family)